MDAGSVAIASGWILFWMQIPLIVLASAVVVVGLVAMRRARPEDIPAVFAAFAAAFAAAFHRRTDQKPPRSEPTTAGHAPDHSENEAS